MRFELVLLSEFADISLLLLLLVVATVVLPVLVLLLLRMLLMDSVFDTDEGVWLMLSPTLALFELLLGWCDCDLRTLGCR